jgi:hypothetical protein
MYIFRWTTAVVGIGLIGSIVACDLIAGKKVELCKDKSGQCCSIQTGDDSYVAMCTTSAECTATANSIPKSGKYPIVTYPLKGSYTGSAGCR